MNKESYWEDIMNITEELQKELHKFTEDILVNNKFSYCDVTTMFLLLKISQLQKDIQNLYARIDNSI